MHVQVIGGHTHKCRAMKHNVRLVAQKHGWTLNLEVITDPGTVRAYGDLPAPALLINGELVCCGQVLTPDELEALWVVSRD